MICSIQSSCRYNNCILAIVILSAQFPSITTHPTHDLAQMLLGVYSLGSTLPGYYIYQNMYHVHVHDLEEPQEVELPFS